MAHNVGPIQVALAGLYGMLGVKDGSNPDIITGFVQPVLDATPWWLRGTQEELRASSTWLATGAIDSATLAVVPFNEWWYVDTLTGFANWDVATYTAGFNFQLLVQNQKQEVMHRTQLMQAGTGVAPPQIGAGVFSWVASLRELWLPPGSRILLQWQGDAAGPDQLTIGPVIGSRARV